ncbi:hypothetical protein BH23ACT3_BH23ACT3_07700 [soil metagenome]
MSRRLPALVIVLVSVVAILIAVRSTPSQAVATYARLGTPWMPVAPSADVLTDSWFCPGVPATGEDGVGGEILIGNRSAEPATARVQWLGAPGDSVDETVTVEPYSRTVLDATTRLTAPFVSAVVEIDGGSAVVEQRAVHPAGRPVSPCANQTSDSWYLAEGFTVGGSLNNIVLSNPFDDAVIVNISFATADGSRVPAAYQGLPVSPRSVRVIDLGAPGAGAQGEERLAVQVVATRGQLVVGRSQHFLAGNRRGYTMSLAAPALRDQWWFADGDKRSGVSEQFSLYNPTSSEVEVDAIFLGVAAVADVEPIVVPARQVVTFDPGLVATLPEGRHATVFSTRAEPSIVVERVVTEIIDGEPSSSVALGAPPAPDGYVASTWHLVAGPETPTTAALIVFNPDNTPGTVSVSAVGPEGPEPVPGLEAVEIGPASIATIDLTADEAIGR